MRELIEKAAEQLLDAAARLQELGAKMGEEKKTIDFQNLSEEDKDVIDKLFNAWTQKNIEARFDDIDEKIGELSSFVDECPSPDYIASAVSSVDDIDFDKINNAISSIDYDIDEIEERAEKGANMADDLDNLEDRINGCIDEKIEGLSTLVEIMSHAKLDDLLLIINDGLRARFDAKKAGNGTAQQQH